MKSWDDDLFNRRGLASDLVAYSKTVVSHGSLLEDDRSLVVAVDAEYGIGKTFFLKGLSLELEGSHPVAYIDAWTDDLLDEPLIAIASIIKKSIQPFLEADPSLKTKWVDFASKTGRVVWIGGKGLLKRGAQLALTGATVEGITDIWSGATPEDIKELEEDIEKAVSDAVEDIEGDLKAIKSNKLLSDRLARFEEGQRAIEDMRRSLSALVNALETGDQLAPIFLIVDELDRCRPSYAIKFLEEVKHLFAVPGIVFVLGLNSSQLAKAVSGLYGDKFNGDAYLDRFVDRKITLPFPPLGSLVEQLFAKIPLSNQLKFPKIMTGRQELSPQQYLTSLLEFHEVSPRNVFRFFDRLQTSLVLVGSDALEGVYLTELIARRYSVDPSKGGRDWELGFGDTFGNFQWIEADASLLDMENIFNMSRMDAIKATGGDSPFYEYLHWFLVQADPRSSPTHYQELLNDVAALGA